MRGKWHGLMALAAIGGGTVLAYEPAAGYGKAGGRISGSAVAIGRGGQIAVGMDNPQGQAAIRIYDAGGSPIATFSDPSWKFISGIQFVAPDVVVFGENGDRDTVFRAEVAGGNVLPLAPDRTVPDLADLMVRDGFVYAVAAGGMRNNDLLRLPLNPMAGGPLGPVTVIDNFGSGFGGGVAADAAGNFYLTDSNGFGVPGAVRRYDASFHELPSISLSDGRGIGAVDLVFDSEGDLFVSTGGTLTQVRITESGALVTPFGAFGGDFPFPTFLAYSGDGFEPGAGSGQLWVSGFTDEMMGGVFAISPLPEPAMACMAAGGALWLLRRRKEGLR